MICGRSLIYVLLSHFTPGLAANYIPIAVQFFQIDQKVADPTYDRGSGTRRLLANNHAHCGCQLIFPMGNIPRHCIIGGIMFCNMNEDIVFDYIVHLTLYPFNHLGFAVGHFE